ncbi:hypothetical protein [Flavobacterium channae]|uniref:hypothetical protein n=1 Tax=Flavobacterium channae TaxID=2897181 RepID=UPI001E3399E7|nr:hypothetical protein [Flavobacterium channae]UGS22507.1 hypothetical protein LOS89_06885 [Flavobacterium channae]
MSRSQVRILARSQKALQTQGFFVFTTFLSFFGINKIDIFEDIKKFKVIKFKNYMKNSNILKVIILIIIFSYNYLSAQQKNNFNHLILTRAGHLNKDKVLYSIVVKQDTLNIYKPYRLEIYLSNSNAGMFLTISTDKAITPDCYQGINGLQNEKIFSDIKIIDNVFIIKHNNLNEQKEHSFQLRGKKFKLIKYKSIKKDNLGKIYYETIDFNNNLRKMKAINSLDNTILYDNEYKLMMNPSYLKEFNMDPKH